MAKALSSGKNKPKQEDEQRSRKKQAKREAKLMVQVDQAKKDVRKSEQKVAKAQTALEEHQARLHALEEELHQFRQASQEVATEAHGDTTQSTEQPSASGDGSELTDGTERQQETTIDGSQSSSLPVEGRDDIGAPAAIAEPGAGSAAIATATTDDIALQSSSMPPAEGRSDIAQEETPDASTTNLNTPIENIPTEQFDENASAQVHADILINPTSSEDDLTISSGEGDIPIVTSDESAWPPPLIREELAESVIEDIAQEQPAVTDNDQHEAETASPQMASTNGHSETEEQFAVTSGEGSIPIVTNDESAWPPPLIREELAESIIEDIAQEQPQATENGHSETNVSEADDGTEAHDEQHSEGPSRPRRTTRRRARSTAEHHTGTENSGQE